MVEHQPRDRAIAHLVAATELAEKAVLGSVESVRQFVEQHRATQAAAAAVKEEPPSPTP